MECKHIGHRLFTKRLFQNLTTHYCVQCLKCGQIVKHNNKYWLKLEDIPPTKTIHIFDEILYDNGGKND